jgi:hypothetical protein
MKNLILPFLLVFNSFLFIAQDNDGWQVLAKKTVNYSADKDVINLTGKKKKFEKNKVKMQSRVAKN